MATLMLASGEHPKVVSERMGHSTVAFTLATYGHVIPGMHETAAQRLAIRRSRGRRDCEPSR
jgi:integrase